MGLFSVDSNWLVRYEYSKGFLSSYKTDAIIVKASSEYEAKRIAKSILKPKHRFFDILEIEKIERY